MLKLKNFIFLLTLGLVFISCSIEDLENNYPCPDGNCDAEFVIDTQQNPGSYQDAQGVWHVKHSGLNYFRIKGQTDPLIERYIVNGVPLIETGYDSNYFYTPTGITWTFPLYSYLGVFSNNNLTNPLPIGYGTYTLPQLVNDTSVSNLAGYEINRYFNFNHPAAQTMLQTYSKYNYTPTQHIPFFTYMVDQKVDIYIRVLWNSDFGGENVRKFYKLSIIFEN
jgi:hypothetical protein